MRRAIPAIGLSALGLSVLLHYQQIVDAAKTSTISADGGAASSPAPAGAKTYDGDTFEATGYGPVQVEAVVSGTKLTDVKALKSPDTLPQSKQINADALPKLKQKALAAQSAKFDNATGATFTSEAYKKSLASALAKANMSGADAGESAAGSSSSTTAPTDATDTTPSPADSSAAPGAAGPSTTMAGAKAGVKPGTPTTKSPTGGQPATTAKPGTPTTKAASGGGGGGSKSGAGTGSDTVGGATFGTINVKVTVANGTITGCDAHGPTDNPTSISINADPTNAPAKLCAQVLNKSTAGITVNKVSGATGTTNGFKEALTAALGKLA